MPYLTGDALEPSSCIVLRVPDDEVFESVLVGALSVLAKSYNWQAFGEVSPEAAAKWFYDSLQEMCSAPCEGESVTVPLGAIIPFAGASVPDGWHAMDGTLLAASEYPDLWAIIDDGFRWEAGGVNYIKLTNMAQRVPVGYEWHGSPWLMGEIGGAIEHTLTVDEMPEHTHSYNWAHNSSIPSAPAVGYQYTTSGPEPTTAAGGGEPHNNMPPYLCVRYIMRVE